MRMARRRVGSAAGWVLLGATAGGALLLSVLLSLRAVARPAGGVPAPVADVASGGALGGRELYLSNCAACHGVRGQGVPRQGLALNASPFVQSADDGALVAFLATGRAADDPATRTGLPMPPRGGNPSLADADLHRIAAYVRQLHAAGTAAADARD